MEHLKTKLGLATEGYCVLSCRMLISILQPLKMSCAEVTVALGPQAGHLKPEDFLSQLQLTCAFKNLNLS